MGSKVPAQAQLEIFAHATLDWYLSSYPAHKVRITRPFYLGKYEITQDQWQAVVGSNPSEFREAPNSAAHPVESVLYREIGQFLDKLQRYAPEGWRFRLPTEAEWEYAARAGVETLFTHGDSLSAEQACYAGGDGEDRETTVAVGSFPGNAWGCHDMLGNVWEFCADLYDGNFYSTSPLDDPRCDKRSESIWEHEGHVLRGGSWNYTLPYCRLEHRGWDPFARDSIERWSHRGLRVVLAPQCETDRRSAPGVE